MEPNERLENEDDLDDQEETDDEFDTNVLTDFCFGDIYGPNYGIRTFLEFEEECEEGSTCVKDIDIDSPTCPSTTNFYVWNNGKCKDECTCIDDDGTKCLECMQKFVPQACITEVFLYRNTQVMINYF